MDSFSTKISVVIPTYNNLEGLKRAVKSVLMQNFEDFEIIITDDSDDTEIKTFVESLSNQKIKYFQNNEHLGAPENWNSGIAKASGEYIKIIHHDDWLADENALGKFVKLLDENPDADFGYAKSVDIDSETGKIKTRNAQKYVKRLQKDCFELFFFNRVGAPSVTVFRNGKNLFYDKNLKWLVDTDFYISCILKNNKIAFINEVLINIGISKSQLTHFCANNRKVEVVEAFYVYNKYKEYLKDGKYQNELIRILKDFNIEDIYSLKIVLPENIEIPEKVIKYLEKRTKNRLCLKKFFRFS